MRTGATVGEIDMELLDPTPRRSPAREEDQVPTHRHVWGSGTVQSYEFYELPTGPSLGQLLGQAVQRADDLARLASEHPRVAAEIGALLDRLCPEAGERRPDHTRIDERHDLDPQLRAKLDKARQLPGHADLLGPPSRETLLDCGEDGPVVVLNVSAYRSDALIVRYGGVQVVPLPGLTPEAAAEHSMMMVAAVDATAVPGPGERANRYRRNADALRRRHGLR